MQEIAENHIPVNDIVRHLSHELRQPLSALESIAFYLQMTVGGETGKVAAQVSKLQQMVDNANWVLSDMLYTLQTSPPHPRPVDLCALVEEILTESWAGDALLAQLDTPGEMAEAWADEEQCRHLARSIFQFLYRTMEEPRTVRIRGWLSGGIVNLEVRAFVPGIELENLFVPLEPNQLFTCLRIAENNRGQFRAEKDGRGELCLRLQLPAAGAD